MAEASRFWTTNGTGDGPAGGYTAQQFYDFLRKLLITDQSASQGVIFGEQNQISCTGSASPIVANTGSAIVYGFFYENTSTVNLSVTTPTVGTTGGRVNLRADWTAQTVRLVANRNTDGVSSPPSLTQTPGSVYELPLYTFIITTGGVITLTDVRTYIKVGTKLLSNAIETDAILDTNVTYAKLQNAVGLSVLGRASNSLGVMDAIAAGGDGYLLRRSGSAISFGQIGLLGIPDALITGAKIDTGTITPTNIQNRTRRVFIPAGALLSDGTSVVTGIGVGQVGGWSLSASTNQKVCGAFCVPSDFVSGGISYSIAWTTTVTSAGNVKWDGSESDTPSGSSLNGGSPASTTVDAPDADILLITQIDTGLVPSAGEIIFISVERDAVDAADTYGNPAIILGLMIDYTADS